jgi:hypothetical protein
LGGADEPEQLATEAAAMTGNTNAVSRMLRTAGLYLRGKTNPFRVPLLSKPRTVVASRTNCVTLTAGEQHLCSVRWRAAVPLQGSGTFAAVSTSGANLPITGR